MQVRKKNHTPRLPTRNTVAVALAALACAHAHADEPSPWYVGASESLTHDSNVNRLSEGINDPDGRGDTYSSTSLLGGFDQSYGRQHFYTKANVAYNKYQHHGSLDNTSYGLNAGWDWASIWNLSGGFYASANQSLAQLNGNSPVQTLNKNQVRSQQYGTTLNWGGASDLSLQAALTHSRVSYSLAGNNDSSANTASLGAYYHVGPTVTTGVAYRFTRTTSSLFNGQSYTSDGRNIDLSVDWRYTVQTGVNARLSFTRQGNSGGTGQDFSGLTGSVTTTYAPTAKLNFNANYSRDAGTNGSFFNVPITGNTPSTQANNGTVNSYYLNSTVANTFSVGANYAATAKIGVNAGYSYRSANISNTGNVGASDYKDNLQDATLGASWAIGRLWSLGCNLSHEKRDVHSVPTYTYSANVIGCSVQATLR